MPHTITPSPDRTYIELKATGEVNRAVAMRQNVEAHALGRNLGIHRYLVDMTECRNTETELDTYSFAYEDMMTERVDKKARVALLVRPDDHSHDFVETVSRNAGLDVTLFRDRALAEKHLRD
ncbi:MAG: hypothetical protein JW958_12980 [Candidatus Eisenbacteria bacterium]|nr:hypothetical protein [Candidatus Eisenbacteria bacterium]